ncbi:hypothetical protein [Carboxylicivirga sp. M1479]|uniref:hypothetical protein n=1 Tax=Carboxylicivirga sp. M1479 TaxID=2594476 RepID=UPI00117770B5|nr:hypothetical protein [Carboxylicivirga sp. M1479]TRX72618.1 hypothetical protein FNN09_01375 [Carboxylicivirga sp. M1479]
MINQASYFLLWPHECDAMPAPKQVEESMQLIEMLQQKAPHLVNKQKRFVPKQSITWTQRLLLPSTYPFKNGQQAQTKGGVVWTDYKVSFWPLMLFILKIDGGLAWEQVQQQFFYEETELPNWQAISQHLQSCENVSAIDMDELDRWYDEVSITHISPLAFHQLYEWFGMDLKEISYSAFDFFMEKRNGVDAWIKALQKHLSRLQTLTSTEREYLLSHYLIKLLKQQ